MHTRYSFLLLAAFALSACGNNDSTFDERGSLTCGQMGTEGCMANPHGGEVPQPGMDPTFGQNDPMPGGMPGGMGGDMGGGMPGGPAAGDASLDALSAWERQDMGVSAPPGLHDGAPHGATPNQIPGGQVITTKGLVPLLQQGMAVYMIDVLGGQTTLPNAIGAAWAAQPGSFDDQVQQQLAQFLQQVTRGSREAPLVFYCAGPQCWMSYNAARRAIALGYSNVLWYRGGLEAWQRSGQQVTRGNDGQMPMSDEQRTQYWQQYDSQVRPRPTQNWQ